MEMETLMLVSLRITLFTDRESLNLQMETGKLNCYFSYKGDFKNGQRDGKGRYEQVNGEWYEG